MAVVSVHCMVRHNPFIILQVARGFTLTGALLSHIKVISTSDIQGVSNGFMFSMGPAISAQFSGIN